MPAEGPTRPPARWPLYLHAAVVAVPLAAFAVLVALHDPADGANIGAGLVLLPLLVLGLPWSLPALADLSVLGAVPEVVRYLLHLGPAVLNVALHALVRRRRHRA
jgi:hypothetical protein